VTFDVNRRYGLPPCRIDLHGNHAGDLLPLGPLKGFADGTRGLFSDLSGLIEEALPSGRMTLDGLLFLKTDSIE
jgi:hypothetical protein